MWPNPQFPADLVTFTEEILKDTLMQILKDTLMQVRVHIKAVPWKYRILNP